MDVPHVLSMLVIGTGLGFVHALDPDHLAAVSGLSSARKSPGPAFKYCLRWAVGHGAALLSIGAAVMFFDAAIPRELSAAAEHVVGAALVALGLWILWDVIHQWLHRRHRSLGMKLIPAASRAADHERGGDRPRVHGVGTVVIGMLHGIAGSAPALALVPVALSPSSALAFGYLSLFGVGVVAAMLTLGVTLHWLAARTRGSAAATGTWLRTAAANAAVLLGGALLLGAPGHG